MRARVLLITALLLSAAALPATASAAERFQNFSAPVDWSGFRNDLNRGSYTVSQSLGKQSSLQVGGRLQRSQGSSPDHPGTRISYVASPVEDRQFDDSWSASGQFYAKPQGAGNDVFLGMFWRDQERTRNWRWTHSMGLRINVEGTNIRPILDYGTETGFSGQCRGDTDRGFIPASRWYSWSLNYNANDGNGTLSARVSGNGVDLSYTCEIGRGPESTEVDHRSDGINVNGLGLMNQPAEANGGATDAYLYDVRYNGARVDPNRWEFNRSNERYEDPYFSGNNDFKRSGTSFAGGGAGEIGGLFCKESELKNPDRRMNPSAYFADYVGGDLTKPLRIRGRTSLEHARSDGEYLFGYFLSDSVEGSPGAELDPVEPTNFLGFRVGGVTRKGFPVTLVFRSGDFSNRDVQKTNEDARFRLVPDGRNYTFDLAYEPSTRQLSLTIDGQGTKSLTVPAGAAARFDRMGIRAKQKNEACMTPFFDDLTYLTY